MSWLLLIIGLAAIITGVSFRIAKRGPENEGDKFRIAAVGLMTFGAVMTGYAFDGFRETMGFYWFCAVATLTVAWLAALVLWHNPTVDKPKPPAKFAKKSRKERKILREQDSSEYADYIRSVDAHKKRRRQYRMELLRYPATQALWMTTALAATAALAVVVWRTVAHASVMFDTRFNPTPWSVLWTVIAVTVAAFVVHQLKVKQWIGVVVLVMGVPFLIISTVSALNTIAAATGVIYESPAEEAQAEEAKPSKELLSRLEATCPAEYRISSKDGDNGLVPDRAVIDQLDGQPDELVSAVDPDLLLELLREKVDDDGFVASLQKEAREEGFDGKDFDEFLAEIPTMSAKEDLTAEHGDVLCTHPYGQVAHNIMFDW